ncbi:MAG TPA: caspase family protein [Microthrixaceae bacterium]|nr:caspase family protein [Microthrixaceae bacterium]
MVKRALCIGINNYPGTDEDLSGCVNDAKAWAALLIDHFGFQRRSVRVLLDKEATHDVIVDGLRKLVRGAKHGDVLVFTHSSHGTYVADDDTDEPAYDEAICPWDAKKRKRPLLDDELRKVLARVPAGVRLTVLLDSCFSGTGTRLAPSRDGKNRPTRRPRFLSPKKFGGRVINTRTARKRTPSTPESMMREVLLAGCSDQQESYDVDFEEGAHGALTYYALRAIEAADYDITYEQLHARTKAALRKNGFADQTPQLEGKAANKKRKVFT